MRQILTIARIVLLEMLRRKDVYVMLILMGALLLGISSLNIFGLGGMPGYVKEIGLLMVWFCAWFLTVNYAARQLPREEMEGTIFILLSKPVTRWQLLFGKWLGAWAGGLAASLWLHVVLAVVLALRGGFFTGAVFIQYGLLQAAFLSVLAAMGVLFSTRMNYDAAAALTYVLSLGAYFLAPRIPELAVYASGVRRDLLLALYFALPHLELFDLRLRLAHSRPPADWGVAGMILAYGVVLTSLLLSIAWLLYRNKRFSRAARI